MPLAREIPLALSQLQESQIKATHNSAEGVSLYAETAIMYNGDMVKNWEADQECIDVAIRCINEIGSTLCIDSTAHLSEIEGAEHLVADTIRQLDTQAYYNYFEGKASLLRAQAFREGYEPLQLPPPSDYDNPCVKELYVEDLIPNQQDNLDGRKLKLRILRHILEDLGLDVEGPKYALIMYPYSFPLNIRILAGIQVLMSDWNTPVAN